MDYYFTDELYHHGVPGMKWGRRKAKEYKQRRKNYKTIKPYRQKQYKKYVSEGNSKLYSYTKADKDLKGKYTKKQIDDYKNVRHDVETLQAGVITAGIVGGIFFNN